jgi:DNA polymerase V
MDTHKNKKIAIVDCNNFYVSCERLFLPYLNNTSTIVMSNNDGCAIARSKEAKDLGVKMGEPMFEVENRVKTKITKFSSNYELYGDISDRIFKILSKYTPKMEVYSIDESFIDLSHIHDDNLREYCEKIKKDILDMVGIPVSIGVSPTKTLSKLMNFFSKKDPSKKGVCILEENPSYENLPISEVWGIGGKLNERLKKRDINTIKDLKQLSLHRARMLMGVVGERIVLELNGISVYPIKTKFDKPKVITSSESFNREIKEKNQIIHSIWTFLNNSTEVLKNHNMKCDTATIRLNTNKHKGELRTYKKYIKLDSHTNDPSEIYNQVYPYILDIPKISWSRSEVSLGGLIEDNYVIKKLFHNKVKEAPKPNLKKIEWRTKRNHLSKRYTTNWEEIPIIR